MSKFTKLVKNPKLFAIDMLKKRLDLSEIDQKNINEFSLINKNLDFSYVNFCQDIPFLIHSGELAAAGVNQLSPWIPIFSSSQVNFVVLVRNIQLFNELKRKFPQVAIAYAKRGSDVEELLSYLPKLRHVFYPSSTGNNIHLVRFNHLNHIFIGHGDSDKQSSAHKALRIYDEIWTAGQAHIDRFALMNFDTKHLKFLKVGRPNLTKVFKNKKEFNTNKLNILYLPTWEGTIEETNYSSTHLSGEIIKELSGQDNVSLGIKYHPFTGNRNLSLQSINRNTLDLINELKINANLYNDNNVSDLISKYQIFICDISGVITECLSANCPIFVYIPNDKNITIAKSKIELKDYCYTFSTIEELKLKLMDILSGNDSLKEKRKLAMDYFLGYDETVNQKFTKQLKSLALGEMAYVPRIYEEL